MNLRRTIVLWSCSLALFAFAGDARADERTEPPVRERFSGDLSLWLGATTTTPYFTEPLPRVRGHGMVVRLRTQYRLSERHALGVEAPLLAMSIEQPAGSYVDEFAWGNVNLFYRHEHTLIERPHLRLRTHATASLALPIAEQSKSSSLAAGRALRVGNALAGFRSPELYTEGVVPLGGSFGTNLEARWFAAEASLRVPLLLRFADAELPSEQTNPLGVLSVLHLALYARVTRWFEISLVADAVFELVRPVDTIREVGRAHLTLEPAIAFPLPRGVRLGSSFAVPVAGPLAGSTFAGSFVVSYRP